MPTETLAVKCIVFHTHLDSIKEEKKRSTYCHDIVKLKGKDFTDIDKIMKINSILCYFDSACNQLESDSECIPASHTMLWIHRDPEQDKDVTVDE